MRQSERQAAQAIFYIAAATGALYGLVFLAMPESVLPLSEDPGAPANPGWVRWSGGLLFGVALAAFLAATQPERQRALVLGLGASYTLIALALLYSMVSGEYRGAQWFILLPLAINAALAAAMFWLLTKQA